MELVRLKQVAAAGLVALPLGCGGIQSFHTAYSEAKSVVTHHAGLAADPATQVVCTWHRKLSSLPDPLTDGRSTLGLTGQLYLQGASGGAAPAAGRVTVAVYDESPRSPGTPERTPEVFDFDPVTLAKLRTTDDRFGPCYALFLPWPKDWGSDVSAVRISARYMPDGGSFPLPAPEVKVAMDYRGEGLTPVVPGSPESLSPASARGFDTRGVPDPARLMQQMEAGLGQPAAISAPRPAAVPVVVPPAPARPVPILPAPAELSPGPAVGQFAPGGGMVLPPKDPANSPYSTEGAWASPPPAAASRGPVLPVPGAPTPIMMPAPGI